MDYKDHRSGSGFSKSKKGFVDHEWIKKMRLRYLLMCGLPLQSQLTIIIGTLRRTHPNGGRAWGGHVLSFGNCLHSCPTLRRTGKWQIDTRAEICQERRHKRK